MNFPTSASGAKLEIEGSADVLQAGIEFDAYCSGTTTASYYSAWYEWYPFGEVRILNFPIVAGTDKMSAEVPVGAVRAYVHLLSDDPLSF